VRAGVVNSAINIYIALDDWVRARDLLALEASTSNTPHYYIGDLADAEEHLGNNPRALELLAEAYQKAKGRPRASSGVTNISTGCCASRPTTPPPSRRWGSK
jgi:hypothetical protein